MTSRLPPATRRELIRCTNSLQTEPEMYNQT